MGDIKKIVGASPNQTSAHYLVGVLKARIDSDAEASGDDDVNRYALGFDVFIKARSYSILNKLFFWPSLLFAALIAVWPFIASLLSQWPFFEAAVAQTTITALAALFYYVYRHYKQRQAYCENLLRHIVFSKMSVEQLAEKAVEELGRIDQGFRFQLPADVKEGSESQ